MDKFSVFGILSAISAIVLAVLIEGGHFSILFNFSAFVLVIGGTFGAVLLQTPGVLVYSALQLFPEAFKIQTSELASNIDKVNQWSLSIEKEGMLTLKESLSIETDTLALKGLSLLLDGASAETIRRVLETDLYLIESQQLQAAKVYSALGGYAPTIGIMGAVLGLVHVMGRLEDPLILGSGIASAFIATLYGVGFANLIFLPIGNKLKALIKQKVMAKEVLLEGIVAIAEGEHSQLLQHRFQGHMAVAKVS